MKLKKILTGTIIGLSLYGCMVVWLYGCLCIC